MSIEHPWTPAEQQRVRDNEPIFSDRPPGVDLPGALQRLVDDINRDVAGAQQVVVDASVDPVLVMESSSRVEIDTAAGAADIYLPPILTDEPSQGAVTVLITAGANPVTLRPNDPSVEGVVGGPGSTLQHDPLTDGSSVVVYPSAAQQRWLK